LTSTRLKTSNKQANSLSNLGELCNGSESRIHCQCASQ
jgi:hypothetical protein